MGKITVKKAVFFAVLMVAVVFVFAFFRGPHISNILKKLILPELSAATGKEVLAEKIYLNVFPLFVEAKEIRVFDNGAEVLHIPRAKGYVELAGLLRKELVLRRLVLREPALKADVSWLEEVLTNVKKYLAMEKKAPIKVVVRVVTLENGRAILGYKDMSFQGRGIGIEALLSQREIVIRKRPAPRINFNMKEVSAVIKGWPELTGDIKGAVVIRDEAIEVKGLQIGFYGSTISARGLVPAGGSVREKISGGVAADVELGLSLLVESFKKIFGLKQRGEGEISAKGTLHLLADDPLRSVVDMKLKGELYLQALLELLKVKERGEGFVDFTGAVKGPLSRVTGTAKARLRKGNLFDVDVDELRCNVAYGEGRLRFTEGKAALYNGRADAEATISVTDEAYYALKVAFSDVDSAGAFRLIGWDPGIPAGKVRGELSTEGAAFDPSGWYSYESTGRGSDVLGRIKRVKGSFDMKGDVVTLSDSVAGTEKSTMNFSGTVDLRTSHLSFALRGRSADLTDVAVPYVHELAGSGEFSGTLTGKADNPLVAAKIKLSSASYEGYSLGDVTAEVDYRKDLLLIKELSAVSAAQPADAALRADRGATFMMKGTIRFPESGKLFDVRKPVYGLSLSMKNTDVERALRVIYRKPLKPRPEGRFDTDLSITGPGPKPLFKGTARMARGTLEGLPLDLVSLSYAYDYHTLSFDDVLLRKGDSALAGRGSLADDDKISFTASAQRIYLRDLQLKGSPDGAYLTFRAGGRGSLDDPEAELNGTIHGGKFRDMDLGEGTVRVRVKESTLLLEAMVIDGRTTVNGRASLKGDMPWTARLTLNSGRYDFLLAAVLKDIPEDLLINMKGYADMAGDRNHFSASAVINQLNVALFGNSFSNDSDIRFEVKDRNLTLSTVKMRSGTTSFKVSGDLEVGRGYNVVLDGSSSLTPLKGFSKKIDILRGEASLVFSLTGKWDNPRISGGVTVSNASFGLRDIPYRIGALNGYFYIDEDRIIIQKLSGKLGGGDMEISGVALLQGFTMKRFYVNAAMSNISTNISKDFNVNFDGTLLYTGTPDSQTLGGDIRINRALYREPVQWQIWPLGTKVRERPRGEIGVFEKTQLNVRLQGSDNILINNNIARASLSSELVVRGTVSNPLLFGRVETRRGIVYFRNNEFTILNATADFADPKRINPTMNVVAETVIEGYTIRLILDGQIEHFGLALSSTPSLEQIEILSLLTGGTLSRESKGIQGGISGSAAASFLSGQVQDIAQERLRSITGIDRIGVESAVSRVTGKSEQRLTVSKRLLGDRLSVTYSTALGSVAADVIKLEYNIGNNISLIGVKDEVGALGGTIKFRFGFK